MPRCHKARWTEIYAILKTQLNLVYEELRSLPLNEYGAVDRQKEHELRALVERFWTEADILFDRLEETGESELIWVV